jgi:hypothetical protein
MLAFAHIPTGTATNKGFDIDEMNSALVEPADDLLGMPECRLNKGL